jgi:hypothetical protein
MNAHSLSSQYEPAAIAATDVPNPSSVWFCGDFAAGVRALEPDAGVRGDFATGMRSATPLVMTIGDFAAGLRTDPAAELARGDFATGQRTGRSDTPSHSHQPGRRGHSPLWPNTAAAPRAA